MPARNRRVLLSATLLAALLTAGTAPAGAVPPLPTVATSAPPAGQVHSDACNPDDLVTVTAAGTITPGSGNTTWYVEYGPTTAYGSQTATQTTPAGRETVDVTAVLPPTPPGPLHYRLVATGIGTSTSDDQSVDTVITSCSAPQVDAQLTVGLGDSSGPEPSYCMGGAGADFYAVMTATIAPVFTFSNPALAIGSAAFAYGPTAAYGSVTPPVAVPWQANVSVPVSIRVDNLTQTVHYALIVTDPAGTQLAGPDTMIALPTVGACTSKLGTTTTKTLAWTLVHTNRGSRSIVIRYRPPCSVGRPMIGVSVRRTGKTITVGVIATFTTNGPCTKKHALVTKTVKLPASLHHRHLAHLKTGATSF